MKGLLIKDMRILMRQKTTFLIIVLLGVGFYAGIKATSPNMKNTLDSYYKDVNFYIKEDYYALVTNEEKKNLKIEVSLYKYDSIYNNMKIGEAKVMLNDTLLHSESIYIKKEDIKKVQEEKNISLWSRIVRWFKSW